MVVQISNINIYQILDKYFQKLDKVPIKTDGFFKQESDKERYETHFMYSFRKFQAALYHFNNVIEFLKKDFKLEKEFSIKAELIDNDLKTKGYKIRSRTTTEISSNHYVYELSAFLEALKSAIDFLAAACKNHFKGIDLDSITPLIRLVKKGKTGHILNQIKKHIYWLEKIRSYRHHLVHRRLFNISTLWKSISIGDKESSSYRPIVIPKNPPKFVLDTRKNRLIRDSFGIEIPYIESSLTIDDEITDHKIEYVITEDYISIEEFMKKNLNSFKEFFADIVKDLTPMNFSKIQIT